MMTNVLPRNGFLFAFHSFIYVVVIFELSSQVVSKSLPGTKLRTICGKHTGENLLMKYAGFFCKRIQVYQKKRYLKYRKVDWKSDLAGNFKSNVNRTTVTPSNHQQCPDSSSVSYIVYTTIEARSRFSHHHHYFWAPRKMASSLED